MRDLVKLFVVVALFSAIAGGLLAKVKEATAEKIEIQQLTFVKGPTIDQILEGCSNKPLEDRFKIEDGDRSIDFFVGEFDGVRNTVAFETFGKGFSGDIGVMVAVNLDTDEIVGIGLTTHSETPGVGSKAKTDPGFADQFTGQAITEAFNVKADGGSVDAVSGATITSRGVCTAVVASADIYSRFKDEILKNIQG